MVGHVVPASHREIAIARHVPLQLSRSGELNPNAPPVIGEVGAVGGVVMPAPTEAFCDHLVKDVALDQAPNPRMVQVTMRDDMRIAPDGPGDTCGRVL